MSVEKESDILAPFKERAEKGEMIEVSEIKAAYQAEADHPIGNSQIYFVLHRQNWRKLTPRSRQPKKASAVLPYGMPRKNELPVHGSTAP